MKNYKIYDLQEKEVYIWHGKDAKINRKDKTITLYFEGGIDSETDTKNDGAIACESTELFDSNGVEIFEGDDIKYIDYSQGYNNKITLTEKVVRFKEGYWLKGLARTKQGGALLGYLRTAAENGEIVPNEMELALKKAKQLIVEEEEQKKQQNILKELFFKWTGRKIK